MFISCGDQAVQILRVLLRMTSESGAVAQTFADLPQNAVCSEVSWGISPRKIARPSDRGCDANRGLDHFVVPTSVGFVLQIHLEMLASASTTLSRRCPAEARATEITEDADRPTARFRLFPRDCKAHVREGTAPSRLRRQSLSGPMNRSRELAAQLIDRSESESELDDRPGDFRTPEPIPLMLRPVVSSVRQAPRISAALASRRVQNRQGC